MPLEIVCPASCEIRLDQLASAKEGVLVLPAIRLVQAGENLPHVNRVQIQVREEGPISDTFRTLKSQVEAAYRPWNRDYSEQSRRNVGEWVFQPAKIKAEDIPSNFKARLVVDVSYFESTPKGDPIKDRLMKISGSFELFTITQPCVVTVTPAVLPVVVGGEAARLTIQVKRRPAGEQLRLSLGDTTQLPPSIVNALLDAFRPRALATRDPEKETYVAEFAPRLTREDTETLKKITASGPLILSARVSVAAEGSETVTATCPHTLQVKCYNLEFPGWLAIDFGTSNSSVTIYDQREIQEHEGLPLEKERKLKELLLEWRKDIASKPQWKKILDDVDMTMKGAGLAPLTELLERTCTPAELYDAICYIESRFLRPGAGGAAKLASKRLYQIYHEAFRIPPLEALGLFPVELDPNAHETEIPSDMEILTVDAPLGVQMGRRVQHERMKAMAQASPQELVAIQGRFHHSPKNNFGQEREIDVTVNGQTRRVAANELVQAAWQNLIQLTEQCRKRAGSKFAQGEFRRAIITYPTVAPPAVRREVDRMVGELNIQHVITDYDEAISAAIFYIMREFGGNLDVGIEAFKSRCRRHGTQFSQNVLVFDIGGGTTDLALIRLTLEERDPFEHGEDRGAGGRYYMVTPRLLGSSGHLQLGGELITLRTFHLLKVALADKVLTAVSEGKLKNADLAQRINELDPRFQSHDANGNTIFKSGSLLACWEQEPGQRGDSPYQRALDASELVIPTRWHSNSEHLRAFYSLWEYAEKAKIRLGEKTSAAKPFVITSDEAAEILRLASIPIDESTLAASSYDSASEGAPSDPLAVEITRTQFERTALPVVREAVGIAKGLVESRLQTLADDERVDWLILSGKTCGLDLVSREIQAAFADSSRFVWNPNRVTFVKEFAKLATSVGACYAEQLRQHGYDIGGAKQQLRKGANQLHFTIRNLFFFLPCTFKLKVGVDQMQDLFKAGDELYQLDREPVGKIRSEWQTPLLTNTVYRQDYPSAKEMLWCSFNSFEFRNILGLSETEWQHEIKVQYEIDQRLHVRLLLSRGKPHYLMLDEQKPVEFSAEVAPNIDPGKETLDWDIAVNVDAQNAGTETIVFNAGRKFDETFRLGETQDAITIKGMLSAPLPPFPNNETHTFHVRGADGSWKLLGQLAKEDSVAEGEYPRQFFASLDQDHRLRIHAGSVPYWTANLFDELKSEGRVFKADQDLHPRTVDEERDPFCGKH